MRSDKYYMTDYLFHIKGVNGQITVYEDRVVIDRRGVMGFLTHGLAGTKSIPIDSIGSIQLKKGGILTNGYIQFGIVGGREALGGIFKATEDENTVMFGASENNEAVQIKEFIEEVKRNHNTGSTSKQFSPADELKKYKELLDMGAITQEEYEMKKKQILGF